MADRCQEHLTRACPVCSVRASLDALPPKPKADTRCQEHGTPGCTVCLTHGLPFAPGEVFEPLTVEVTFCEPPPGALQMVQLPASPLDADPHSLPLTEGYWCHGCDWFERKEEVEETDTMCTGCGCPREDHVLAKVVPIAQT